MLASVCRDMGGISLVSSFAGAIVTPSWTTHAACWNVPHTKGHARGAPSPQNSAPFVFSPPSLSLCFCFHDFISSSSCFMHFSMAHSSLCTRSFFSSPERCEYSCGYQPPGFLASRLIDMRESRRRRRAGRTCLRLLACC
jgi:hypothetical protein